MTLHSRGPESELKYASVHQVQTIQHLTQEKRTIILLALTLPSPGNTRQLEHHARCMRRCYLLIAV